MCSSVKTFSVVFYTGHAAVQHDIMQSLQSAAVNGRWLRPPPDRKRYAQPAFVRRVPENVRAPEALRGHIIYARIRVHNRIYDIPRAWATFSFSKRHARVKTVSFVRPRARGNLWKFVENVICFKNRYFTPLCSVGAAARQLMVCSNKLLAHGMRKIPRFSY